MLRGIICTVSLLLSGCVRSTCADKEVTSDESTEITVGDVDGLASSLEVGAEELSCEDFCSNLSSDGYFVELPHSISECTLDIDLGSVAEGAETLAATDIIGNVLCSVTYTEEGHETYGSCK